MLNDDTRTLLGLLAGNVVSALVLFALVEWSAEQVAIVNAIVGSVLTLGFRIFRQGQGETSAAIKAIGADRNE